MGAVVAEVTRLDTQAADSISGEIKRMKEPGNDPVAKKLYETPKILTISLRPEEAVLGNCKISASGTGLGHVGSCSVPTACFTIGS